MPYTPPAQRSPAASRPDSPQRTRDGLGIKPLPSSSPFLSGPRPNLPRSNSSTSYIHRQRRSPSSPLPVNTLDHEAAKNNIEGHDWASAPHASLRQSPPPINNHAIPTGTIISPPDSGDNSSDDEGLTMAGRGKKLNTLVDLQAAISVIEKEREGKPDWADEEKRKTRAALGLDIAAADPHSGLHALASGGRLPLSKEARKISHSRSATETNIQLPRSQSYSPVEGSSDSDELDDETAAGKPKMLRKKSGELVRPALRPASARRRPSSMPGTPTFSKAVHFSSDLEHVRHFLQVDKPLAVSAETSPVDMMEDESEYPFPGSSASTANEWELRLANFPAETLEVQRAPVKVERVFLSSNKKTLIGTVAVQNLAFNKQVIARFTYDYWKTTSEVSAEFSHDVRRQHSNDGLDRFNFNLQLADQNNLENKTLFFCVRYVVNGQEFWDSNNGVNYQVDFSKKATVPQRKPAKNEAVQHLNGLPRSRSPQHSPRGRRNFDDFGMGFDTYWSVKDPLPRAQSAVSLLEDNSAPLKFRSKASGNAFEDLPGRRQAQGPAQALGNRYDFNKSLSAALTAASNALGERSGLAQTGGDSPIPSAAIPATAKLTKTQSLGQAPTLAPAKAQVPPSPSPQNLSYEELVEKFCFFGNGNGNNMKMQSSPPKNARPCSVESSVGSAQSDGAASNVTFKPSPASPSPATSPIEIVQAAVESVAERLSRSTSPSRSELGSRAVSPIPLASFYHQPLGSGFVTPTAIQG